MQALLKQIEVIRSKLEGLRSHGLKETPTRRILVDPLLEALGWDVCDPGEVVLEFPTVDGKSVDYALKLNGRPVLLVEAKALDDPLADVKAITQVVAYAANAGIVWCVLTNGARWKIYRSIEQCPAPQKLMYEVSVDPRDADGLGLSQIAEKLGRLSRTELARGTLDALGEQTFTDGKVRKALTATLRDPPRPLVNMIRSAIGSDQLAPNRIRESLQRIAGGVDSGDSVVRAAAVQSPMPRAGGPRQRTNAAAAGRASRRGRPPAKAYDERDHTDGKPREVIELYRAIERVCFGIAPGAVQKRYYAKCIGYTCQDVAFCSVHLQRGGLRVWLWLKFNQLQQPPAFARDVTNVGHWGGGDLELDISDLSEIEASTVLIRQSFESRCGRRGHAETGGGTAVGVTAR